MNRSSEFIDFAAGIIRRDDRAYFVTVRELHPSEFPDEAKAEYLDNISYQVKETEQ